MLCKNVDVLFTLLGTIFFCKACKASIRTADPVFDLQIEMSLDLYDQTS